MDEMALGLARGQDLSGVLDLLERASLPVAGVERHFHRFVVAHRPGSLVGCAGLEVYGATGLLRSVAVAERERGGGLGHSLVAEILARARDWDCSTVVLLTTTAEGYFRRFGFRVVDRADLPAAVQASAELQGACPQTAAVMRLDLEPEAHAEAASPERNKEVIRELLRRIDFGDLSVLDECFAQRFVDHTPSPIRGLAPGFGGLKETFEALRAAFPDTTHTIEDLVAEGDRVVTRLHATATHTGPFLGIAPTGKKIELTGIAIYRLLDGRIVERWSALEGPGVLDQVRS